MITIILYDMTNFKKMFTKIKIKVIMVSEY